MIPYILIGVAVLVLLFAVVVATRPAQFQITRSTTIAAPAQTVFAHVNDLHKWEAWSPWAKLDPDARRIYEGAPEGPGAVFKWAGNKKIGEGSMTILENRPAERLKIRVEFVKPFRATNFAEFTFQPAGNNKTAVTWSMTGTNNFLAKAFHLFINMDKMIGSDFEKGLASLKEISESAAFSMPA